jgi:hypothetical protein
VHFSPVNISAPASSASGVNVMVFKIFSPEKLEKTLAILTPLAL